MVYTASGQYLAATRVANGASSLVESKLYWAACDSVDEARFLATVFNAPIATQRLSSKQSRGQHNPRDFHKLVFQLPIPLFDSENSDHVALAALGVRAEGVAAAVDVSDGAHFTALRRRTREALQADGVLGEIDEAVRALLDR